MLTRARALTARIEERRQNHGSPASVTLTSTILASHGGLSTVSSAGGPATSYVLRLIRTVTAPWFAPPTWSLYRVACDGSPEYLRASFWIATFAVAEFPKHPLKSPPAARAPASAC